MCAAAGGLAQPGSSGTGGAPDSHMRQAGAEADAEPLSESETVSLGGRIKRFFFGNKLDKERLAALGTPPC